jgi:uncharacterized membrane protein
VTYYGVVLFLHLSFAIIWIGAGMLFHVLGFRAQRSGDDQAMRYIFDSLVAMAPRLFIPSSLLVLIFGVLLTIEGPWSFGDLWILVGLAGFAITFATGMLWIEPQSKRVKAMIERDGGMSPEANALAERMMVFARLDYVVLFVIVFDMSIKPTGGDVGALLVMAAALVAGVAYFGSKARAIEIPATSAAQPS